MKARMFVVFLLFGSSAVAQFGTDKSVQQVRVQIDFVNRLCDASTHVALVGPSGPVADEAANNGCVAEFANVPTGTYQLSVSRQGFTDADAGTINASSTGPSEFKVRVKPQGDLGGTYGLPVSSFVSAADLGIPARAHKEFVKANDLFARQDFTKAIQKLNKAIAIYPAYAVAYNNLGVIYSRLDNTALSRDALQKAISINDHCAPAYLNLGRLSIRAGDFPSAETMLTKASSFDPTNAVAFALLGYTELMSGRLDEAIANGRKAHVLHGPHAVAHQVAARALEKKGKAQEAIAELELFLQEEPTGPRAEDARKELETVKAVFR